VIKQPRSSVFGLSIVKVDQPGLMGEERPHPVEVIEDQPLHSCFVARLCQGNPPRLVGERIIRTLWGTGLHGTITQPNGSGFADD
jgi:hypothetical protein